MEARLLSDQRLDGRYVLREQVGRGGFGVVWRAYDSLLQRDVAVKAIEFPSILDDAEQAVIRKKVLREAQAAARLSHPGLVTVFDVIEEGGRPLIVMELVKAPTLADLVARNGPLPESAVTAIGRDVLEALGAAHAEGIIHRDVKPANVMVAGSGRVQLGDFGIAAVIDDPKLTNSGNLAGSPSYMAPEQAEGRPPSAATDLWGLGATLYFAVEGRPPFAESGAIATLTSVVNSPHRPLGEATALAPLIDALLAKDPDDRPSAAEARRRLDQVLAAASLASGDDSTITVELDPRGDGPRAPTPTAPPPIPGSGSQEAPTGSQARLAVAVVGCVVVLVALIVVAVLAGRGGKDPSRSSANPGPSATGSAGSGPASATATAAVPTEWVRYQDPATGFSVSHPPDWKISTNGTLTDIRDPDSGTYLRIDHREPPGPSAEGAWYEFEPTFSAQNADYKRIQITPTTYQGHPAAIWEYTYSGRGAALRAVDLGFIAASHGFALNFQSSASDWDHLQPVFSAFKASFSAPAT